MSHLLYHISLKLLSPEITVSAVFVTSININYNELILTIFFNIAKQS